MFIYLFFYLKPLSYALRDSPIDIKGSTIPSPVSSMGCETKWTYGKARKEAKEKRHREENQGKTLSVLCLALVCSEIT